VVDPVTLAGECLTRNALIRIPSQNKVGNGEGKARGDGTGRGPGDADRWVSH
jgi:hypothetical protein